MSSVIRVLSPDVINLIAAGEVIDSFAAVVRELVENSLDAGANRITVSLFPDIWRVQVADNGQGISLTDLQTCGLAHSTSKIHTCDDLVKIVTLGFRGEALHSLAQLAQLEIFSCLASESGWHFTYDQDGQPGNPEPVAMAPGTIVKVSELFGNLPVRRRALTNFKVQLKAVQNLIQKIALCYPQVTWRVNQNNQSWLNISPGATAKEILPQILKQVQPSDLQFLSREIAIPGKEPDSTESSTLELVIGLPDRCHRRRADWLKVGVNGRMVRLPEIEQTILARFAKTLPRDRYPVGFVHLHVPPEQIDWNRHPAKAEIYLHNLDYWCEQVSQAITEALRISPANLGATVYNQRVGKLLKVSEKKNSYQVNRELTTTQEQHRNSEIALIELRAVAQVRNTYIVAEHPNGLWLVEQHIAHERILYEQLLETWEIVPLANPLVLNNLNSAQLEQLECLGLLVEPFGEQMWMVRSAPKILHQRDDCTAAIIELSQEGDLQAAQVATACRSAIRNGTSLSLIEMQAILDDWQCTRNPLTCPHGRPIYLPLEESALARFFRRHWVIGKSHGI